MVSSSDLFCKGIHRQSGHIDEEMLCKCMTSYASNSGVGGIVNVYTLMPAAAVQGSNEVCNGYSSLDGQKVMK